METVGLPKNLLTATLHLESQTNTEETDACGMSFIYPSGGHMLTNGAKFKTTIYITLSSAIIRSGLNKIQRSDWLRSYKAPPGSLGRGCYKRRNPVKIGGNSIPDF
jgi:hypothetical protein